MSESREMWALFSAEATEHLEELDKGLLRLEKVSDDRATLERVFRAAHSLKGAARMMGAWGVEEISHAFEDALMDAKREQAQLADHTIEALYKALDGLRSLVHAAVANEPSNIDVEAILSALRLEPDSPGQTQSEFKETTISASESDESLLSQVNFPSGWADELRTSFPVPSPEASLVAFSPVASPQQEENSTSSSSSGANLPIVDVVTPRNSPGGGAAGEGVWKIETMRVDPARLDALLSLSGELLVGAKRAQRGKAEIEGARAAREDALKIALQKRQVLRQIEAALGSSGAPLVREMERFFAREGERWELLGTYLDRLRVAADEISTLENVATELEVAIRGVRLLPLSTLFGQFPRAIRDLAKSQGKQVELLIEGGDVRADKRILEELKDPLLHLVRNALDHGIEAPEDRIQSGKSAEALLQMRATQTATQIIVEIQDDGRGLSTTRIAQSALRKGFMSQAELDNLSQKQIEDLIFAPGFSTAALVTDLSGRGVGLDVVRENVENLRGQISVESVEGKGCIFRLALPVTLATTRVLLVRAGLQTFAVPIDAILSVHHINDDTLYLMQGRRSFTLGDEAIATVSLREILHLPTTKKTASDSRSSDANRSYDEGRSYIVLSVGGEKVGVGVDLVVDEQEIILKSLGRRFRALNHLAGATILENGDVCLVLNPQEILKLAFHKNPSRSLPDPAPLAPAEQVVPKTVLLCEDSITTRTQEKRILENAGYVVTVAVDGADGWEKLRNARFDAIVTDVEMPLMDGFELTRRVREHEQFAEIPVILVTTLSSDEDRMRGLDVGASAYITKGGFEGKTLIETLRQLV